MNTIAIAKFLKDNYDFIFDPLLGREGQLISQDNNGKTIYTAPIFNYSQYCITFHPDYISFELKLDQDGIIDFNGLKSKSINALNIIEKVLRINNTAYYSNKVYFDIYYRIVDNTMIVEKERITLKPDRCGYYEDVQTQRGSAYVLISELNLKRYNNLYFEIIDDVIINDYIFVFLQYIKKTYNIEFDFYNDDNFSNSLKLFEILTLK